MPFAAVTDSMLRLPHRPATDSSAAVAATFSSAMRAGRFPSDKIYMKKMPVALSTFVCHFCHAAHAVLSAFLQLLGSQITRP